jgi:hypothetical protein
VTARVLVTAKCRSRHHVLAELLAVGGSLTVRVPSPAAGRAEDGRIHNKPGSQLVEPLGDGSMSYPAVCGCGVTHVVSAGTLERARVAGEPIVVIDPMR